MRTRPTRRYLIPQYCGIYVSGERYVEPNLNGGTTPGSWVFKGGYGHLRNWIIL